MNYARYVNTLIHLKPTQVYHQILYRLRDRLLPVRLKPVSGRKYQRIKLSDFPGQHRHYSALNTFTFLNVEQQFIDTVDWNFKDHGKLWTYHLNYFDYLHQHGINWDTGKELIDGYVAKLSLCRDGLEPYPISLRTINWIKFLAKHDAYPQHVVDAIYAQYQGLTSKLEYHLLGNHLLENGFSLLFGAVFFNDKKLIKLTRRILNAELTEQILDDGAHFELSPMYHLILLQRALDGYNLLLNNEHELVDIQSLLQDSIQRMVNWMGVMLFRNGDYPMFNDSTPGQALEPHIVLQYASRFGFEPQAWCLSDSGYRKFTKSEFELIVDVGQVGPSYQPGHANCDLLSFVLYYKQKPIFVDRGISTYEKNALREEERGTASHNTVMINGKEQSDVWGAFRVGRRAKPIVYKDTDDHLIASHTGYDHISVKHQREWQFLDNKIVITDTADGNVETCVAYFHMHPQTSYQMLGDGHFLINDLSITFSDYESIELLEYQYCEGFNKRTKAQKLAVYFKHSLKTTIRENT